MYIYGFAVIPFGSNTISCLEQCSTCIWHSFLHRICDKILIYLTFWQKRKITCALTHFTKMHIFFVKLGLKCKVGKLFQAFTIQQEKKLCWHCSFLIPHQGWTNFNKPIAVYTPNPKTSRTSLYGPIWGVIIIYIVFKL